MGRVESLAASSMGDAFTEYESVREAYGAAGSLGDGVERDEAVADMKAGSISVP